MNDINGLQKSITETKYLSTDNTYRYRPIMRFFYHKYEEAVNWLYKEDIYPYMKELIPDYSMEELERDLTTLVDNMSLVTYQDYKNIQSLTEFKNRKLRYQMTDYAIEIERMTIRLEELEVKVASLSPKRFEVLKGYLEDLIKINFDDVQSVYELWDRLMNEFIDINQNYQDFLKKFQESKTEELLQSYTFLEYKDKMIRYLRDFIQGYLLYSDDIKRTIKKLKTSDVDQKLINALEMYQRAIPMNFNNNFDYEKFRNLNLNRWNNLCKWFVNNNDTTEGDKMLDTTNAIIVQITKCANSLQELHGNMIKRKEEYKFIAKLFDSFVSIDDANKLSSQIFGVTNVMHFNGNSLNTTDLIVNSYDVKPNYISIDPNNYKARDKKKNITIEDKTSEKNKILKEYFDKEKEKKKILKDFIRNKYIKFDDDISIKKIEREYILDLISRYGLVKDFKKEPVFGLNYKISFNNNGKYCTINCEDGILSIPCMEIWFDGDLNE